MSSNRQSDNSKRQSQNSIEEKSGPAATQQPFTSSPLALNYSLMQSTIGNQDYIKLFEQLEQTNEDIINPEYEQQIVISGSNTEKNTVIKSASDLLIWLVSHPISSNKTPMSFAEIFILKDVLNELWKKKEEIQPDEVWDTLGEVIQKIKDNADYVSDDEEDEKSWDDDELDTVESGEEDNNVIWKDGDWAAKEEHGIISKEPARYRRKMPLKDYEKAQEQLANRLSGYDLVGVHATRIENMGSLVKEGVSKERFGKNHGVGKGNGFYIIPTNGTVNKSITDTAMSWGDHYVAVYLPKGCILQSAMSGENVQTLEEEKDAAEQCYYRFGAMEAVIPPSLCDKVILVSDPADISMADSSFEAEVDTSKPLEFLNALPNQVKSSNHKK